MISLSVTPIHNLTAQSAFVSAMFKNKMNVIQRKAETDLVKPKSAWESAGVKVADDKFKQHHKAIADLVGAVKGLRRPIALFAVLVCPVTRISLPQRLTA